MTQVTQQSDTKPPDKQKVPEKCHFCGETHIMAVTPFRLIEKPGGGYYCPYKIYEHSDDPEAA